MVPACADVDSSEYFMWCLKSSVSYLTKLSVRDGGLPLVFSPEVLIMHVLCSCESYVVAFSCVDWSVIVFVPFRSVDWCLVSGPTDRFVPGGNIFSSRHGDDLTSKR